MIDFLEYFDFTTHSIEPLTEMTFYFKKDPRSFFKIKDFEQDFKDICPEITGDLKTSIDKKKFLLRVYSSTNYGSHVFFPKDPQRLKNPKIKKNRDNMVNLLRKYEKYLSRVGFDGKYGTMGISDYLKRF